MGEYAEFIKVKKLKGDDKKYQELRPIAESGKLHDYLDEKGIQLFDFGSLRYYTFYGQPYYSHIPLDMFRETFFKQVCKYNIDDAWLLCYTYDEMRVSGGDVGLVEAATTVEKAVTRLKSLKIKDINWLTRRRELLNWIEANTEKDDVLFMTSAHIYYSTDGEFNENYVKNDINQRVKEVKAIFEVPYWTCKK